VFLTFEPARKTKSGDGVCSTLLSMAVPFASGDRIVIHGLQARADLNGYSGVLLSFDGATQRWEVLMETTANERIRVKPVNMREAGQTDAARREDLVESARAMKKAGAVFGFSALDLPADANPADFEQRFQVYTQAASALFTERNTFKGERAFTALFNDMVQHPAQWDVIFSSARNMVIAERSVGVLGTLATMYRQRQNLDECERVLAVDSKVLHRYRDMVDKGADPAARDCCYGLVYKYNHIRFNVAVNRFQQDKNLAALKATWGPLLRELVGYTIMAAIVFLMDCVGVAILTNRLWCFL
jgi:hypothetical protein